MEFRIINLWKWWKDTKDFTLIVEDLIAYIERGEHNGRPVHFVGKYVQALTSWKDKEVKLARLKGGHHALADLDKWIELHELDGDQIKDGIVHMMESLKQQFESLQSQGGKNE